MEGATCALLKVAGGLASAATSQGGWELCREPGTVEPPAMAQTDDLTIAAGMAN